MDNDYKAGILFILVIILFFVITSCNYVKKNELRELMEDKLVDEFLTVSLYLEGEEYSREEALDAFNTIEKELNKLY